MKKVVKIREKRPEQALKHLNRLTGLDFHCLPESLLSEVQDADQEPAPEVAIAVAPAIKTGT